MGLTYARPESLDDACSLLSTHGGDAAILSGGQSLLPLLRRRVADYDCVIDINHLPDYGSISVRGDTVRVGCLARHCDVASSDAVAARCRPLRDATAHIGDVQVRNRGTLCGSLAHADPSGDPPVAGVALDGELVAASADGERTIPLSDFYDGFYETALADDELVVEARFPVVEPPRGGAHVKYEQSEGAYPLATVSTLVELDDDVVSDATIVVGGVEPKPTPLPDVAAHLVDAEPTESTVVAAAEAAREAVNPVDDAAGGEQYKRELVASLVKDSIETAVERAGE